MNPRLAIQTRKEFIEADYVDGIFDAKGAELMRPLTEDERQFLYQYYQETEHCDFLKNPELDKEQKKLKSLRKEYFKWMKENSKEHPLVTTQRIKVETLRDEISSFYPKDSQRAELYSMDYERRKDIFNVSKITNNLDYYSTLEFDRFTQDGEYSADDSEDEDEDA